jgi:hypothetical protein
MSLIELLSILSIIKANHKPFWQQDWKKHRRRGWKRAQSSGRAR